jgi:hypothetical protein
MSEVDQYEYLKSCEPQGINLEVPYTSVQYNFTNDINNSIYTNSSLSLVQFNLSSLFNSSTLIDLSQCFLIIPTVTVSVLTNGASNVPVPPASSAYAIHSLKTNNACIIHSLDLQCNGKTVSQLIPYSNLMYGFDLASQMSKDDLTLHGKIRGFSQTLDNPSSAYYSGAVGGGLPDIDLASHANNGTAGPGLVNNSVWNQGVVATGNVGSDLQLTSGTQNAYTINSAINERVNNTANIGTTWNNFSGAFITPDSASREFRSYTQIVNNYIVTYDYIHIRLGDVNSFMENAGLMRKADMVLRLYINTGLVSVSAVTNTAVKNLTFGGSQYSTFANTCPITINSLGLAANYAAGTFTDITTGFFIGRSPNYSITTDGGAVVNFGANFSSQMNATRFYYPSITLEPLKLADYLASQQAKTVVNRQFLYNVYNNIGAGATFSQLIQSGVSNIKAVVIMPFISATMNSFSQLSSPFDTAGGCSFAPISLINLSVQVGGIQVNNTVLSYQYEQWIEQLSIYNKSSATELGVESGLISKNWWDNNRVYIMNVRNTLDDALTPRNVVVSFLNNSNVAIDVTFFIVYENEWVLNCATGEVMQK